MDGTTETSKVRFALYLP